MEIHKKVQEENDGTVEQTTLKIRQLVDKSVPNQLLNQYRIKLQTLQGEIKALQNKPKDSF